MMNQEPKTYRIYFADQARALVSLAQSYLHISLESGRISEYIAIDTRYRPTINAVIRATVRVRQKYSDGPIERWRLLTTIDDPTDLFDEDALMKSIAVLAKETGLENWAKVKKWIQEGRTKDARRYLVKRWPWFQDMSSDMWNDFLNYIKRG